MAWVFAIFCDCFIHLLRELVEMCLTGSLLVLSSLPSSSSVVVPCGELEMFQACGEAGK